MRTIVVVGGALSGPAAAISARETDPRTRILLLERSTHVRYAVCGLAYHMSGEVRSLDRLNRRQARVFRDGRNIQVRPGTEVLALDATAHTVRLGRGALRYDSLIYAGGAESVMPAIPGLSDARNVFRFRTPVDLQGIAMRLRKGRRRVAILGGGFMGVEAADGLLRRGCKVTLAEKGPQLLPRFSPQMGTFASAALRAGGAKVVTNADVVAVDRKDDEVESLRLRNGDTVRCDLVIVAVGLRPRTDLLRAAGARLLENRTVAVDDRCQTSLRDVYACGVCVSLRHAVSGKPVWFAQAAQADKSACVAGVCAAGGEARLGPAVGTAILRAGTATVAATGLTAADARAHAGSQFACVRVQEPSCDEFLPGSAPVSVELFYHRRSGQILGAEVAGRAGADKRVDVLATAIRNKMTVQQLATLDLAYAPPYSTPRDPVNAAAMAAVAKGGK